MVLVIEDDNSIRTLVELWLEMRGEDIIPASSGGEAIEILRKKGREINLIFLDQTLPDMTGKEVLEQIRADNNEVPVVIASGHDIEALSESFSELKVSAYLHKPFLREDLDAVMDQIFQ